MCGIPPKLRHCSIFIAPFLSCWSPVWSVCMLWPVYSCMPFTVRHGRYNYCYPSMVCLLHSDYMHRSHCMGGSAFGCTPIHYRVKSGGPRGLQLGMKRIHKNVGDTALISQKCINGSQVPIKHWCSAILDEQFYSSYALKIACYSRVFEARCLLPSQCLLGC